MLALCWHTTPAYYAFYYADIFDKGINGCMFNVSEAVAMASQYGRIGTIETELSMLPKEVW